MRTPTTKMTIELTPEQPDALVRALAWAKALAAPHRLVLVGWLAAPPAREHTVDELESALGLVPQQLWRELQQLADAGLITITAWATVRPGTEPYPERVAFNPAYAADMAPVIAALHKLVEQVQPAPATTPPDARTRLLARLFDHGLLLRWPDKLDQEAVVLDEIIQAFAPTTRYSEREVDAILKAIYPPDHCTPRRALVDTNRLARENGVYWRVGEGS